MMPPKKSKAARKETPEEVEAPPVESKSAAASPKKKRAIDVDENDIVEGKRKRTIPICDLKLSEWLEEHLEEREETKVSQGSVYSLYVDSCVEGGYMAAEMHVFIRENKAKFKKGFGVKESSPYNGLIKEKKIKKKVVKKVQAESLRLKMKDIIENAIREHGNPKKGVRFHNLKTTIAAKYPALRIDLRPDVLKNALAKGMRHGYVIAVRGIGACGLYRVPPAEGEEEEEEKTKAEDGKKGEKTEESKDDKADEESNDKNGTDKDGDADKENAENDADTREDEEVKGQRKTRGAQKKTVSKGKTVGKGKGKSKKKSKPTKKYRSFIVHSDPQRVEDCFEMALTYMSEPKSAGFAKMKKYFADYYPDVGVEKLKKAVIAGEEKGFWILVSGTQGSGIYELTLDELDPSTDDNINSMIANSIIACNEPKQASARCIKQYILDYHTDFKIDDRPHLFKKALERAISKSIIRQITGIGASGSFQLVKSFVPTPTQLQGEDDEDYYNQSSDEEDDDEEDEEEQKEQIEEMLQEYRDKYVPRPTKRRGHGRTDAAGITPFNKSLAPASSSSRRRRR